MAAKISKECAQAIRVAVAEGRQTRREAAEFWDVSLETIHRIIRGETHRRPGAKIAPVRAVTEGEITAGALRMIELQKSLGKG